MSIAIDRKAPFYTGSLPSAYYGYEGSEKQVYIESAIVDVDCILFMEQAKNMSIDNMADFAKTVVSEYGARRPLSLLSEYVLKNTEDRSLIDEALKFLTANSTIHVRMNAEPEKLFALFRCIFQEAKEEMDQYRLFDERDCEPLEGEKSLGRILVMSVDGIPLDVRTQENQLAIITPELLEKLDSKADNSGDKSYQYMSTKVIGVLKEELVSQHIRDTLSGMPAEPKKLPDRPPIEIDRKAPLYTGDPPSIIQQQEMDKYMASTAANIDFFMEMEGIPDNEPEDISLFAERLVEIYGEERSVYLLEQYFKDYNALNGFGAKRILSNRDLALPNFGYYPDGRMEALYDKLKTLSAEMAPCDMTM